MTIDDGALVAEHDAPEEDARARLVDLEVLYRLADAIGRAATLAETLDEALDALPRALGLERAAVLLADEEDVLRFEAWRGLSAAYRASAEGHRPWPRDARDPQPVLVPDVDADRELAPLRERIRAEGVRALAFVPLLHRERLLGMLVLHREEPGPWRDREVRLAQAIATHVAAAAERHRASAELEDSRRHLEVILRDVADGITVQDRQGRLVYANDAAARTLGLASSAELLAIGGAAVLERFELIDETGEPLPVERLPGREALAGVPEPERLVGYRARATGDERWALVRATPVFDDDGAVELAINVFHDVTARRRTQEAAAFLSEAGVILASSLDYETTLATVARLAVPRVADWCIVYMREEDGSIRRLALEHSGGRAEAVAAVLSRFPLEPDAPSGVPAVIRTGEPLLLEEITSEQLMADVGQPDRLAAELEEIQLSSYLCVPLIARGRTLGAISLLAGESGKRFTPEDLELASELARRAALAVDNARLFASVQQTAALLDAQNETVVDGLLLVSPDGRIASFNRRFAEIWGMPEDVLARGSDDEALAVAMERVADPEAFVARVRHLYAHPDEQSRDEVRFRDGRVLERYGMAVRGRDGTDHGYLWSFRDVTEQKRVERELEARANAAEALEFVGEGILLVDAAGVVRLWNPAAAAITGLAASAVEGRPASEAIPRWEELRRRVPTARPSDPDVGRSETVPVELGGRELWLSVTAVAFGAGTVYAFRDVTEERGLERLKSEFVSTVSHELRTPLSAIYGAALTLRRADLALSDDLRHELLGVVAAESDRLARIVNDILWTSRIESAGLEVRIESCDARELAAGVVAAARVHLPEGIEIELHAPDELPRVAADPDKVRQVLSNLVENAVKYSLDPGRIAVRVSAREGSVRFAVADEGLGIPPGERDRVFEKFYRLDPDLTRGVGGTGLGLYICRELVRRMDGWIWVEPNVPRGSVFVVQLPAVR
ncbi:MAG TPA: GAF domain-containing protein [Gaiellaceae bacterium]|nr:GAF domain-containing protein [Gaiellaceae bacterium]